MKQFALTFFSLLAVSMTSVAQDDVYFVPTKKALETEQQKSVQRYQYNNPQNEGTYEYDNWADTRRGYRDTDEYNRRHRNRKRQGIDSLDNYLKDEQTMTGRIVRFYSPRGVITASPYYYDYYYDLALYDPWFSSWGWNSWYGWYDPFFYRGWGWSSWYSPWGYSSWYSPWGFSSWYSPWHFGWGWNSWYSPYHWYGYHGWGGYAPYYDYSPRTGNYYGNTYGANYRGTTRGGGFASRNDRSASYRQDFSRGTRGGSFNGYQGNARSGNNYSTPSRNENRSYRGNIYNSSRNGGASSQEYYPSRSTNSSRSFNSGNSFNSAPSRSSFSSGGGFSGGGSSRGGRIGGRR